MRDLRESGCIHVTKVGRSNEYHMILDCLLPVRMGDASTVGEFIAAVCVDASTTTHRKSVARGALGDGKARKARKAQG